MNLAVVAPLAAALIAAAVAIVLLNELTDGFKPRPHCPSCQTLVWPSTVTCPNCGAPLLFCQGHHESVEHTPDAIFCHECGRHLKKEES